MTPEAVNSWFTPFHYIVYLGVPFVSMVVYYQWKWAKVCKESVLVLIQKADGHGDFQLAPQEGGSVSLKNLKSNTIRLWPINELVTIDVPYPGVGFVPAFLQKTIRMVLVSESDWEPLTNRGAYREKIASPDIVTFLTKLAEDNPKSGEEIRELVSEISIAPTKELIASPAVLGNLMHEKITEAVITVNKEMLDSISGLVKRLTKLVNPTVVYIGLGLTVIVLLFLVVQILPAVEQIGELSSKIDLIYRALGVTATTGQ